MLNITDDYVSEYNTMQIIEDEEENFDIKFKLLLLSIPGGVLLLILTGLVIWSTLKHLFSEELKTGLISLHCSFCQMYHYRT